MLSHFYKADASYGSELSRALGADPAAIGKLASALAE
jgi:hypothetical protein